MMQGRAERTARPRPIWVATMYPEDRGLVHATVRGDLVCRPNTNLADPRWWHICFPEIQRRPLCQTCLRKLVNAR